MVTTRSQTPVKRGAGSRRRGRSESGSDVESSPSRAASSSSTAAAGRQTTHQQHSESHLHRRVPSQLLSWALLALFAVGPVLLYRYIVPAACAHANESVVGSLLHHQRYKTGMETICSVFDGEPRLAVQAGFVLIFDVLLYVVSLFLDSTWLIDPLWTIVPVQINFFYSAHKLAEFGDDSRSALVSSLIMLWSSRLSSSYIRRERFLLGVREDWRYEEMRAKYSPLAWKIVSFFVVNVAQHVLLYALTFPLLDLHGATAKFANYPELIFGIGAFAALLLVWFADTQLYEYTQKTGKHKPFILDDGLWGLSRHPNYVLEQAFWWALALWAYTLTGNAFTLLGAALNTACLLVVTYMVERSMLHKRKRKGGHARAAFEEYRDTVPFWLPPFGKGELPFEETAFKLL